MNLAKAIDLMVAAKEDPVLAAWTFMILEIEASPQPDAISPYDAWDAFQQLYGYGLITADEFRRVDPERTFFAQSAKPTWGAVQSVLYAYQSNKSDLKEPPMSKNRIANPFDQSNDALVTREPPQAPAIPAGRTPASLSPFGSAAAPLSPFSTTIRPIEAPGANPFGNLGAPPKTARGNGLPCNDPNGSVMLNGAVVEPEMYCCGKRLEMANDGGQIIGPDDLPGNLQGNVVDAIFHGICQHCQKVWHVSVGQISLEARR